MRMKGVHVSALVGLVIGATLFGWSDADAVLCVKSKKGVIAKVTIRDGACKGKESVGDPSVLLGLPTTTTSPPTTTTLPPLTRRASRIVDSAGNDFAWVTISPLGSVVPGVWALRTTDDGAVVFPMTSNGPATPNPEGIGTTVVDDFQHRFLHQGTQCVGGRFLLFDPFGFVFGYGDLVKIVYPSADGKTGDLWTSERTDVAFGFYSQDDFKYRCAEPGSPAFPPTVTCDDDGSPAGGDITPVGSAFPCDPNKLGAGGDPTTQCTCIRCCVTRIVQPPDHPPIALYRVQTIDLDLGNGTPPFRIEP